MAKVHTDKRGHSYVKHEDVMAEEMSNPEFRAAYAKRRRVQEIARTVRALREGAGLSQADLAAMIGTKQPAIARLETSQYQEPQWNTLDKIAMALHKQLSLTIGELREGEPIVRVVPRRKARTDDHDEKER